ncbi:hypothetical protein PSA7680_02377 [Pseudoruegeria aquimaris]|uniref:Lipoprotein n=1 Tax=Pseudoruegeria aquimaris TaxID=393663 RepID=A0A1Y5ST40_9RHOB|nr:hypothetical protein [Pseudoruegeria aquimaris]SLN46351.1 hypothetical protein PSA7680_02377 [Pseudoruegeria aquimaris]
MRSSAKTCRARAAIGLCALLLLTACAARPPVPAPPPEETVARMTRLFRQACLAHAGDFAATEKALADYGFDAASGLGRLVSFVDTRNFLIATVGESDGALAPAGPSRRGSRETYCSVSSPNVSEAQALAALRNAVNGFVSEARLVQGDRAMRAAGAAWIMIPTQPRARAEDSLLAVTQEDLPLPDFYLRASGRADERVPVFRSYGLGIVHFR